MDMLSFASCLKRVLRRRQESITQSALNTRLAYHADDRDWGKWNRAMERLTAEPKGPEAFHGF